MATENIWQQILQEANTHKEIEESHLFIFGDKNTGKRSLIKSINKELFLNYDNEERSLPYIEEGVSRFSFIDFKYLNVKKTNDTDNEILTKMHVWMINAQLEDDIFESIFKPEYLIKAVVIITLDLTRPGELIDQLKKWCLYFYEKFSRLLLKLPFEKQIEIKKNQENFLKLWEEDQLDNEGNKPEKLTEEVISMKLEMPLKEKLLEINLGVPVVFCVNKSDIVVSTNERKKYEEDSEFILKHVRRLALTYGATTIYTSTKTNTNIQILYEYLLHRLYKFDFTIKPNIIDKESYFIPAGYDSLNLLQSFDFQEDLKKIYTERIVIIKAKLTQNDEEIQCEDSQQFLKKFWEKPTKTRVIDNNLSLVINQPTAEKNKLISEVSKGKIEVEVVTPTKQISSSKIDTIKGLERSKIVGEPKASEKPNLELFKKKLEELRNK